MRYFDTFLLLIIILMGCWIIYRDYTNTDLKKYNAELMVALPQIIRDAIDSELYPPELYEESNIEE